MNVPTKEESAKPAKPKPLEDSFVKPVMKRVKLIGKTYAGCQGTY